jgi:MATE family multidrug resistance protein
VAGIGLFLYWRRISTRHIPDDRVRAGTTPV